MILKPADLKKMVSEWLAAGYTVDLDLETGRVKVQPTPPAASRDPFDLVDPTR